MIYVDDMRLAVRKGPRHRRHIITLCHMSSDIEGEADRVAAMLEVRPCLRRACKGRRVYWVVPRRRLLRTSLWMLGFQRLTRERFNDLLRQPYTAKTGPQNAQGLLREPSP